MNALSVVPQRLRGLAGCPAHWSGRALGLTLCVLAATLYLSACGRVEVRPTSHQASNPRAARPLQSDHALAVLGVDYDPPLDGQTVTTAAWESGVTLLVAVANQGANEEQDVEVSAALFEPQANGEGGPELAREMTVVPSLTPGELRVVRFEAQRALPFRNHYQLRVSVRPAAGELDTTDNVRTYEILVADE